MDFSTPGGNWPLAPPIEGDSIDELFKVHVAIAIHVWAPWNGYDRPMAEVINKLIPKLRGEVDFFSCNIDNEKNNAIVNKYKIATVPTLLVLFQGVPHCPIL